MRTINYQEQYYEWYMPTSPKKLNGGYFSLFTVVVCTCFRSLKFLNADIKLLTQACGGKVCLSFVKILNLSAFSSLWISVEIRSSIYYHRFGMLFLRIISSTCFVNHPKKIHFYLHWRSICTAFTCTVFHPLDVRSISMRGFS